MLYLRKIAASFAAKRYRIITVLTSHGGKMAEEAFFNNVVFLGIFLGCQAQFRSWYGWPMAFLCITVVNTLTRLLYIRLYDLRGRDIFGIESLKEGMSERTGFFAEYIVPRLRKDDRVAFLLLSLFKDPFIAVVYLRRKEMKYRGFGAREWRIFGGSIIVSSLYWTIRWGAVIELVKWVW